jgi:propanol-preferring alcohol dehydrogenase
VKGPEGAPGLRGEDTACAPADAAPDVEAWCAMAFERPGQPLKAVWRRRLPEPGPGQVRIRVAACGVCRTDLHIVDGDLPWVGRTVVPGHEVVGRVEALGLNVAR